MKYPVLDGHCDTAVELWRKGESLAKNSGQISLAQAAEFPAYVQFFAFCTVWIKNAQTDEERFASAMAYFSEQLREHNIPLCRTSADVSAILQNGGVGAALSIEGAEAFDCDPGRLEELAARGRADDCAGVERGECAGRFLHDRRRIDGAGARIRAAGAAGRDPRGREPQLGAHVLGYLRDRGEAHRREPQQREGRLRPCAESDGRAVPRDLRSWRHGGAEPLRAVFERVRPRVDGRCAPPPRTLFGARTATVISPSAAIWTAAMCCRTGCTGCAITRCWKQILKIGASASRSSGTCFINPWRRS